MRAFDSAGDREAGGVNDDCDSGRDSGGAEFDVAEPPAKRRRRRGAFFDGICLVVVVIAGVVVFGSVLVLAETVAESNAIIPTTLSFFPGVRYSSRLDGSTSGLLGYNELKRTA